MWNEIKKHFEDSPSKLKVAKLFVEMGIRIDERCRIYVGEIELSATKIAEATNVDRRIVRETAQGILESPELRRLFLNLQPAGPLLKGVSKYLGYGVVEIRAEPKAVGVIAQATNLIAGKGISIRQILAEDAEIYPDPKLIIITEKPLPGELLPLLLKIPSVTQVTIS